MLHFFLYRICFASLGSLLSLSEFNPILPLGEREREYWAISSTLSASHPFDVVLASEKETSNS